MTGIVSLCTSFLACILLLLNNDLECCIIPCSLILYNFITYSVLTSLPTARAIIAFPGPSVINYPCGNFKLICMQGYSQFCPLTPI